MARMIKQTDIVIKLNNTDTVFLEDISAYNDNGEILTIKTNDKEFEAIRTFCYSKTIINHYEIIELY